MNKRFLKKLLCVVMVVTMMMSMTGCGTKAKKVTSTKYTLTCCGTATLYSDKKCSVSGCKYFTCKKAKGRWKMPSNNYYEFWTTDKAHSAWGQRSGNTMTIEVEY